MDVGVCFSTVSAELAGWMEHGGGSRCPVINRQRSLVRDEAGRRDPLEKHIINLAGYFQPATFNARIDNILTSAHSGTNNGNTSSNNDFGIPLKSRLFFHSFALTFEKHQSYDWNLSLTLWIFVIYNIATRIENRKNGYWKET